MYISSLDIFFFLNEYISELKDQSAQNKVSSLKNLFPLISLLVWQLFLHFNTKHSASYLSMQS